MYFEPSDLSKAKLPTKRDVICYLKLLKQEGSLRVSKHHKLFDYSTAVTNALCELWQRANIPIVSQSTIRKKIVKTVETYYVVNKKSKSYNEGEWNELFQISRCKCGIESNKQCICPENERFD